MVRCRAPVRSCTHPASSSSTCSSRFCTVAARSACASVRSLPSPAGAYAAQSTFSVTNPPSPVLRTSCSKSPRWRGRPYDASAITLYSSLERWKPRCAVRSSYSRPSELRQRLRGQHLEPAADVVPGQVRGALPPAIEDQRRARAVRPGQSGRRRVRHVVRDEPDPVLVQPRQGGGEKRRSPPGVLHAQVVPGVVQVQIPGRAAEGWVEGVGHGVQVARAQTGLGQAPAGRLLGQLPRREGHVRLAVLAAVEPLLLRRGDETPVHDERGRRVVEDGVDTEHSHGRDLLPERRPQGCDCLSPTRPAACYTRSSASKLAAACRHGKRYWG